MNKLKSDHVILKLYTSYYHGCWNVQLKGDQHKNFLIDRIRNVNLLVFVMGSVIIQLIGLYPGYEQTDRIYQNAKVAENSKDLLKCFCDGVNDRSVP